MYYIAGTRIQAQLISVEAVSVREHLQALNIRGGENHGMCILHTLSALTLGSPRKFYHASEPHPRRKASTIPYKTTSFQFKIMCAFIIQTSHFKQK